MNQKSDPRQSQISAFRKYLVFRVNGETFAVPLSEVREVIGLPQITPIPGAPEYFMGMINLRGKVISAIDLRKKLGSSAKLTEVKRPTIIITDAGGITLGCSVDLIAEVLSIEESQIERSLEVKANGTTEFVQGIARFRDRDMILILDLRKAVDISELIKHRPNENAA